MIEEPPLLTIKRPARRPTAAQIAAFQGAQTGHIVDAMFGAGALDAAIGPVSPALAGPVAGPALTAWSGAADILATSAACAFVQPGDVVVAAVEGHRGCAASGDIMAGRLKNAGAIGFVTDGPMRDVAGIEDVGLPCWCAGLTPGSPFSTGPGSVGLPVTIGGQRVETGDMIIADRDGVVVAPFDRLDEIIAALAKVREAEDALIARVEDGFITPESMAELLASDRVAYVD